MDMKSITALTITIIIIGIVLGIGFLVLSEFGDTLTKTTTTVENETLTTVTETGEFAVNNFSTDGLGCYGAFTVIEIWNATDDGLVAIPTTNYTTNTVKGLVTFSGSCVSGATGCFNNTNWNITYTYESSDSQSCAGLDETIDATEEIPAWLSLIVIISIVGIILYIVFKLMPKAGEMSGGSSGTEGVVARI